MFFKTEGKRKKKKSKEKFNEYVCDDSLELRRKTGKGEKKKGRGGN